MQQALKFYPNYCKWNCEAAKADKGFIVAADVTQEWLLPWWWDNYVKHNSFPVAFVDFGLSKEMKDWCKKKGIYIPLPVPDVFVSERNSFSKEHIRTWEEEHGTDFWVARNAWFKKPLACLQTPFKQSIWMDLDCEVKGSLLPMFSIPLGSLGIALAKEYHRITKWDNLNSGVILFEKGIPLIEEWAEESLRNNRSFVGDQGILHSLILAKKILPGDIPLIYNWTPFIEENPKASVIHWTSPRGKEIIAHKILKARMQEEGFL